MNTNNKRGKLFLILLIILLVLPVNVATAEEEITKKRVISLIYDDSGSMWFTYEGGEQVPSDNWKYANYSLQSLVALLGEEDHLQVVRMAEPSKIDEIKLPYSVRQKEINRILQWEERGWTPFEIVLTASERLKKAVKEDQQAEYWFIIVMDGVFNDLDWNHVDHQDQLKRNYEFATNTLIDFKDYMNNHEVKFNSILVTIESFLTDDEIEQMAYFKDIWDETMGGLRLTADSEEEIIERINEVAALITNRDPNADESNVTLNPVIEENHVKLYSPYPLRRITVLEQIQGEESSHRIQSVSINNESIVTVSGPFQVETPYDTYQLREPIYGSVSHIAHQDKDHVIPEGEYTLTFSEEINPEHFRFIAEPAIDFDIAVHKLETDGTFNSDPSMFFYGSDMKMEVQLVQSGDQEKRITLNNVNPNEEIEVVADIDGSTFPLYWDEERQSFIGDFQMPKEDTEAVVTVLIHGFYQENKSIQLIGVPDRELSLIVNNEEWNSPLDRLDEAPPILVTPMIDGREITESELSDLFEKVKVDVGDNRLNIELNQNGNKIEIRPLSHRFPMLTTVGEIPLTIELEGKYAGEYAALTFPIYIEDISFWAKWGVYITGFLIGLLFLTWLFGAIKKPRFAKNSAGVEVTTKQVINGRVFPGYEDTQLLKTNFFQRWIVPYKAEKATIENITFKATPYGDRILLTKESQTPEMDVHGRKLEEDSGRNDLLIYSNDEITVKYHNMIQTYKFIKN